MTTEQLVVTGSNLSYVWARVFLRLMSRGVGDACPLVATITGFADDGVAEENAAIRKALDDSLTTLNTGLDCHQVANTIFPASQWNRDRRRQELFNRFRKSWPRVRDHRDSHGHRPNKDGTYFQRLCAFGLDNDSEPINQLDHILNAWDAGLKRRSAFQAVVFDPRTDHKRNPYLKFPCLHQVAFTPVDGESLHVTAFYGMQYMKRRAYGNYVGLCRLGRFMAHEMGLQLARVTCVASAAKLDFPKNELQDLASRVRKLLPATELREVASEGAGDPR